MGVSGVDVQDKGVVVTGAGLGIGRAIATRMAAEGARVVLNDLDKLQRRFDSVGRAGGLP